MKTPSNRASTGWLLSSALAITGCFGETLLVGRNEEGRADPDVNVNGGSFGYGSSSSTDARLGEGGSSGMTSGGAAANGSSGEGGRASIDTRIVGNVGGTGAASGGTSGNTGGRATDAGGAPQTSVTAVGGAAAGGTTSVSAALVRRVQVVILDPFLDASQRHAVSDELADRLGIDPQPERLVEEYKQWLSAISNGRIRIETTVSYQRAFPLMLNDADETVANEPNATRFQYTPASYLECLNSPETHCHNPDRIDYVSVLKDAFSCEAVNQNAIDEVWLFGAPYFGFYAARLTGPGAFYYSAPSLAGTTCNRIVPIMGFNFERTLTEMATDFHFRAEATMNHVYGSVAAQTSAWTQFSANCGNSCYAVNSSELFVYTDPKSVESYCDDFLAYPNLPNPPRRVSVNGDTWGNSDLGFRTWWFKHLPAAPGRDAFGKLNDWWQYVMDANLAARDAGLTVTP
ncbi:MAG: hypothetical protein QM784_04055 [Polyangiaceae bacterium]